MDRKRTRKQYIFVKFLQRKKIITLSYLFNIYITFSLTTIYFYGVCRLYFLMDMHVVDEDYFSSLHLRKPFHSLIDYLECTPCKTASNANQSIYRSFNVTWIRWPSSCTFRWYTNATWICPIYVTCLVTFPIN